jgi:hypothetical protein
MRADDQALSRTTNGFYKVKERDRRQKRLVEKLKAGKAPYGPAVMSWLSQALNKPSGQITPEDVSKYVAEHQQA